MDKLRELIKSKIKEISATSQGGASFSPGEGAQYATPFAFRKKKIAKGAADIYYYKLGFKPVPKIKPKSYDIKKLFEIEKLNELNNYIKFSCISINLISKIRISFYLLYLTNKVTNKINNFKKNHPYI